MIRRCFHPPVTPALLLLLLLPTLAWADFDERLWERYLRLETPQPAPLAGFGGVWLEPRLFTGPAASPPLADLRLLTDERSEVPFRVEAKRPACTTQELPAQVVNNSVTPERATWVEARLSAPGGVYDAVEIVTEAKDFYRQVEVLGSADGKVWNVIRPDGVIFDYPREERLRRLRVTIPPSAFPHVAVRVTNGELPVLPAQGLKVLRQEQTAGETVWIAATLTQQQTDPARQETILALRLDGSYPVGRLILETPDVNFQRGVRIEAKREGERWEPVEEETIFDFTTDRLREKKLDVDFPDIVASELRLVVRNHDSPPLRFTGVRAFGWKRLLVFRLTGAPRYYLFHGNPRARAPLYDVPQLLARQGAGDVVMFQSDADRPNTKFAGHLSRLPFTERYKYAIYAIVVLLIAGLVALQWRVFRAGKQP